MNTVMNKEVYGIVKVHSTIDLITNSSTEIFCVVEGHDTEAIQDVIDQVLEEFECNCFNADYEMGIYVHQRVEWDDDKGEEVDIVGEFEISGNQGMTPCKFIMKKIEELLVVVKPDNED